MKPTARLLLLLALLTGCGGEVPDDLGMTEQRSLRPCPSTPNCVHTGMQHPEGTSSLVRADGVGLEDAQAAVRVALESMPRTRIVTEEPGYLHAEATSFLFRFVDDVEVLFAGDGEIIVRSASRVGRSDLGVNSKRVEELRSLLTEAAILR